MAERIDQAGAIELGRRRCRRGTVNRYWQTAQPQGTRPDRVQSRRSDAGSIKQCTKLETLWLGGTSVSNSSLAWIQTLPKLQFVALENTQVSVEEAKKLNEKLQKK